MNETLKQNILELCNDKVVLNINKKGNIITSFSYTKCSDGCLMLPALMLYHNRQELIDFQEEAVNLLLEYPKTNINADNYGTSILVSALRSNNIKYIEKILAHDDIDINYVGFQENTALHIACYHGQIKVIQMLLAMNNIDLTKKNEGGHTFLDETHKIDMKILLKHPKIDLEDSLLILCNGNRNLYDLILDYWSIHDYDYDYDSD